ncbi:MarR family winged helix-turn-helix transcriptional regulator [Marinimicrococcus flavescens]|uniref:MarR family transcriptional regulator n=1 Tax=Marinimicrococcus flavescens TaxID=3031815 RepID=A0AAP3XRT8_9PROT|nr:MarR family transcriptional regulator [Marinimicrococcus flavescens]
MTMIKADYERLAAWRYALRRFLRFSELAAAEAGLTPQQHQALLAVKGFPGRDRITIGDLAERLQIRHHSAVGLADRLVAQNLLRREQGVEDRREVYVSLTQGGEALLGRISVAHKTELARIGPDMTRTLEEIAAAGRQEVKKDRKRAGAAQARATAR